MGPGGAGRDDDTVQVVLLDEVGDLHQGVLSAGVLGLDGHDDMGQGLGVLDAGGDVDHRADVDTAVAYPDTDAGLLAGDILLGRVDLGLAGDEVGVLDDVGTGLGGGTGCLGDGGRDVLGRREGTGHEDSLPGGLERVEDGGLGEPVLVQLDAQGLGELLGALGGLEPDGQDDDVEGLRSGIVVLVGVVDGDLLGLGILLDVGHTGSAVHVDAVLVLGPLDVGLELLSVGPDVHEEDVLVDVSVLLGDLGLLGRVHAAHGRAVSLPVLLMGPGSAALDPCDGLGAPLAGAFLGDAELVVDDGGGHRYVSVERTGGAFHPLVLDGGDDVLEPSVSVLGRVLGVPDGESGGDDDGSDIKCQVLVLVLVADGLLAADLRADTALVLTELLAVSGVDERHPGHSLRVGDVDGPPGGEPVLELVGDPAGRALRDAVSARGAEGRVDVPGLLGHGDLEVSRLTVDFLDLVVGHEGDVGVTGCIRHLGGQDARRAVVRGEGLVEHAHGPADRGQPVHEVDVDVPVRKIERRLYTGDSSADHKSRFGCQFITSVPNFWLE